MPSDYKQIKEENIRKYGTDTDHLKLLSAHYTNNTHFVFELLQNAEDAKASRILFTLFDDRLEVTHNGRIFNERDVKSICGVGKGTKADDLTQIGKFGIGFKSVYVYTSAPEIFSGDESFKIKHYVRPYALESRRIEEPWTTCFILPFDKEDFNPKVAFQEIGERLCNLNSMTMLFLRNIVEIEYRFPDAHGVCRRHDINTAGCMRQVVIGTERENWLIFERPIPEPDSNNPIRVEVAFKLETDLVNNIEGIRKIHESPLFVYFPTERHTRLGFLIQGPYRTTLARDNIRSDDTWNQKLISETASLVVESMHQLKKMDLLTVSLLEVLPLRVTDFAQGSLFHPIFSKVRRGFMNNELLPANDGAFISAQNAMLADSEGLRNLLNASQLRLLFERISITKWMLSDITEKRHPDLWRYLRNELEIEEVDPEMFARRLSMQFLQQQSDEWFIKFYKFLSGGDRPPKWLWSYPWSILRSKPILRLQDDSLVNPSSDEGRTSAYVDDKGDTDTSEPIVKLTLTQDEEVRKFLKELGVPEWDIVEEVIKHVFPKYECGSPTVPVEEHKTHFAKIERAYDTDPQNKQSRLRTELLKTPFILTENISTGQPTYLKPNQLYFPSDELRRYFEDNDSRAFVNLDEYPPSARELLNDLDVMDEVKVNMRQPDYNGYVVLRNDHGDHERGLNGFDPEVHVDGLQHAINNTTTQKSEFIWKYIAKPNANCIRGIVEQSGNKHYRDSWRDERISNDFGRLLIETAWLPDSAGQMHRPCELTLNDLPESFKQDVNLDTILAEQLGMRRDEVAEFAVRNGLRPEILNNLIQNPQEYEEFREWRAARNAVPSSGEGTDVEPSPPRLRDDTQRTRSRPTFPVRQVPDPDRRRTQLDVELENLPAREREQRVRSVQVNTATEYTRVWLKAMYTNDDDQMVCQVCQKEMPFKKRDGKYYFEAVEALTYQHFSTAHEAQFLALCPECAARYQVFIKKDEDTMQEMINQLMVSDKLQIPLQLGELNVNLRFVETHWRDIKQILGTSSGDTLC